MISRRHLPELKAFEKVESELPFREATEYRNLVVPDDNETRPVHQWFTYKESFSAALLDQVFQKVATPPVTGQFRLLDPYCGVGTSLLSAQLHQGSGYEIIAQGIDCNPFSAFVAKTKLSWPSLKPDDLRRLARQMIAKPERKFVPLPQLSSITTGRCISRHMARRVMSMRLQLEELEPSCERDALLVGLASCIEPVSRVRRDGRALRIVEKPAVRFEEVLASRWETIAKDVETAQATLPTRNQATVQCGDGRDPSSVGIAENTIDLVLTSPPYPNNIDYNEVYKLELWFMGFARSDDEFLTLRRKTFRSHPTCRSLDGEFDYESAFVDLLEKEPLADLFRLVARRAKRLDQESSRGRTKVLLGYAYDTWRALKAHARVLAPGGRGVYVVGNSLHGVSGSSPYLIPTDLIVSRLAQVVGLTVEQLIVARPLVRRLAGNHFLRDSLIVVRKGS